LADSQGRIEHVTQSDINAKRLSYQSQPDIGTWTQLDTFDFKLAISDSGKVSQQGEEYAYRIENSYSNMPMAGVQQLVPSRLIQVSKGLNLNFIK
jgi:hypothetical protein